MGHTGGFTATPTPRPRQTFGATTTPFARPRSTGGVRPSTQTALSRGGSVVGLDLLTERLLQIQELAGRGDPAFQEGSAFFQTGTGSVIDQALQALAGGGEGDGLSDAKAIADIIRASTEQQAASDSANLALQRELGIRELELSERTQSFTESDIETQRLLEAAGLATGPTGAIQLAFLARGQGAPQEDVAAIFQNLPFVQALLAGETLPSFGLPGQLGGEFNRVSPLGNVIEGENLGVTIPSTTGVSRTQFQNLTPSEQAFLGALGQSETGTPANEFLEQIMRTFIPENTGTGAGVSIGF